MGGGLDLALACHMQIAHPHATFGHRGAALGLITGWGGTQRLPRLIGKSRALKMFVAGAEKLTATQAFRDPIGNKSSRLSGGGGFAAASWSQGGRTWWRARSGYWAIVIRLYLVVRADP